MIWLRTGFWLGLSILLHLGLLMWTAQPKLIELDTNVDQGSYSMRAMLYQPPKPASQPPQARPAETSLPSAIATPDSERKAVLDEPSPEPLPAKPEVPPISPPEEPKMNKPSTQEPETKPEKAPNQGARENPPESEVELTEPPEAETPAPAAPSAQGALAEIEPVAVKNPSPPYPFRARRAGYEGTVTLAVTVAPNGQVQAVELAQSSGYKLLDQQAIKTVREEWHFESIPSEITTSVRVEYTLK